MSCPSLDLRIQLSASKPHDFWHIGLGRPPFASLGCTRLSGHPAFAYSGKHNLYSHPTSSFPFTVGSEGLTCPPPKNVSSEMQAFRGLQGAGAEERDVLEAAPRLQSAAFHLCRHLSLPMSTLPSVPPCPLTVVKHPHHRSFPAPPAQCMRESPSHLSYGDQNATSIIKWLNSQFYSSLTYLNANIKTDTKFSYWKPFEDI